MSFSVRLLLVSLPSDRSTMPYSLDSPAFVVGSQLVDGGDRRADRVIHFRVAIRKQAADHLSELLPHIAHDVPPRLQLGDGVVERQRVDLVVPMELFFEKLRGAGDGVLDLDALHAA